MFIKFVLSNLYSKCDTKHPLKYINRPNEINDMLVNKIPRGIGANMVSSMDIYGNTK
jgi:hypothetical protein